MRKTYSIALFAAVGLSAGLIVFNGRSSAKTVSVVHKMRLYNSGFGYPASNGQKNQAPANWFYYGNVPQSKSSVGITKKAARSGVQSLRFHASSSNAIEGYWQRLRAQYNALETVMFSAYIKADPHSPLSGSAVARLGVEFHLPGGPFLNQQYLTIRPSEISTTHWKKFTVTATPLKAISGGSVHFVVSMTTGNSPGGAFYVDDTSAKVRTNAVAMLLHNSAFRYPASNGLKHQAPANWLYYGNVPQSKSSVGITKTAAGSGVQSLRFRASSPNAIEGYWQGLNVPFSAMETVVFSAYLKADTHSPLRGSAVARLGVEFHFPGGQWLNQNYLTIRPSELSTTHWKKFTVTATPLKAISGGSVHFVVSMTTGSAPSGTFYVDNVSAKVRIKHGLH